jgi:hypothetical protein
VELIGDKHPDALGRRTEDVFPEAFEVIGPLMRSVLAGEGPAMIEHTHLPLNRAGFVEECWFTYCYSPVHGDDGRVEGVLDVVMEITGQVIASRRQELVTRLSAALSDVEDLESLRWEALRVLVEDRADLPEVDLQLARAVGPGPAEPGVDDLSAEAGVVRVPLQGGRIDGWSGELVVRLSTQLRFDADYRRFLGVVAATISRALARVDLATAERRLSTALQRSLLTEPARVEGVELAVRYRPASRVAQVGGDWYDAFVDPTGDLVLVVGDVAGHDQNSAAAMGQLRNMLRALAVTLAAPPARLLTGLDEVIAGLDVEVVATVLVARCRRRADGGFDVSWSSAGHLPPVVLRRDGLAELHQGEADVLLGASSEAASRSEWTLTLAPGDTLVLYTDGLVERRDVALDESLTDLVSRVANGAGESAEALSDRLLVELGSALEDDVVLAVLGVDAG